VLTHNAVICMTFLTEK